MVDNTGKVLAYSVTLWDESAFEHKTFYPGDTLPGWAAAQIRNPKAFRDVVDAGGPMSSVPGRDVPVPGPSQLAHNVDAAYADQPRYQHAGSATSVGVGITEEPGMVLYAGPPMLHDHVAAHAKGRASFTSDGAEKTYEVRTGQAPTAQDQAARDALLRDESDARRAQVLFEDRQREYAEAVQRAEAAVHAQALALQGQAAEFSRAATERALAADQAVNRDATSESATSGTTQTNVANAERLARTAPDNVTVIPQPGVAPTVQTAPPTTGDGDGDDMTVAELRDALKARGLPMTGSKSELRERLDAAD